MTEQLVAKGHNGQVEFDGRMVTIKRDGFFARVAHGKNEKSLPLRQITAVQLKPVSLTSSGYIQFTVPGETSKNKRRGSAATSATKDENSVIFTKKHQSDFEALAKAINAALADL